MSHQKSAVKVTDTWVRLDVGTYPDRATFFGATEEEVNTKYRIYIRRQNQDLLPHVNFDAIQQLSEESSCGEKRNAGSGSGPSCSAALQLG